MKTTGRDQVITPILLITIAMAFTTAGCRDDNGGAGSGGDTSDVADAGDAGDTVADVGSDADDAVDSSDAPDSADVSDSSDTVDAADGADAMDSADSADVADSTDATDVADSSDAADSEDTADSGDAVDEETGSVCDAFVCHGDSHCEVRDGDPVCVCDDGDPLPLGEVCNPCIDGPNQIDCECIPGFTWNGTECDAGGGVAISNGDEEIDRQNAGLFVLPPRNLLINGGAQFGDFSGWDRTEDAGLGFTIGPGLFDGNGFTCDGADGLWNTMVQEVDLIERGLNADWLATSPDFRLRLFAIGNGVDFDAKQDPLYLSVELLNADREVIHVEEGGSVDTPINSGRRWLGIGGGGSGYGDDARYVRYTVSCSSVEFTDTYDGATLDGAHVSFGAIEMRIANEDGVFGDWRGLAGSLPWTLSDGLGEKTVCVQFRDAETLEELSTVCDTIQRIAGPKK